ncbi:MAG: carboxy-S-adenosyl-L-methionine synthase CmoA [Thermodesulfobacteriota bacterium]|nr:carboxy-S-adenosyl-L-methionine synthase CmoA [Thermodesulfobacteriota bacterium]
MKKDQIFAEKKDSVSPFEFNKEVASVFDDMLIRSVPLYHESIKQQSRLCCDFFQKNTEIYDLGCSNGNLGIMICKNFKEKPFSMTGVDTSSPMIEKYRTRLKKEKSGNRVCLVCDFAEKIEISNASVVIVNLTMQFINLDKRDELVNSIYHGLASGGVLLLTEKIAHGSEFLSELQLRYYKNFKKENGYSELEISQKRDALEKVLIPETIEMHTKRLERAGFKNMDVWLKWFNFASIIAVK